MSTPSTPGAIGPEGHEIGGFDPRAVGDEGTADDALPSRFPSGWPAEPCRPRAALLRWAFMGFVLLDMPDRQFIKLHIILLV